MFIHIGGDVTIPLKNIIGMMDIDNTTVSKDTRDFLKIAEEEGFVVSIREELPKTFIIAENGKKSRIYLTPISTATLYKRARFISKMDEKQKAVKKTNDNVEDSENGKQQK